MAKKYLKLSNTLKQLLFDHDMKPVDLARKTNIPPPTIHRIITGKSTRPYQSSLKPIADFFSISIEQLLGGAGKSEISQLTSSLTAIPLIPWKTLQLLNTIDRNTLDMIPFSGKIGNNIFATIIPDSSMEPIFGRGSILIFDTEKSPFDRSYVLVQLDESDFFVFRQLIIDLNDQYLKPLNPDLTTFKMKILRTGDKVIGTLIEARQIYRDQ